MSRVIRCAVAIALIAACRGGTPSPAPPSAPVPSRPASGQTSASRYLVPTRTGPECDSAIAQALEPGATGVQPPRPDSLFLPPLPVPRSLNGRTATIRFLVDVQGRTVADSLRIEGLPDRAYESRLRRGLLRFRFRPAVLAGCAVPGRYRMTITL